jgi:hypothetical protein
MVAVPAPVPVTTPVAPTVAIAALLLVQVPPLVASVNVVLLPTQMLAVDGVTAAVLGAGLTVTP